MTYAETIQKLLSDCPPIPTERLKAVKKIITHGGKCPDGKASAMILKKAYEAVGLNPEIQFVVHGTKEHSDLKPEPGLLFCDFCVPEENWEAFVEAGTLVLDHHKGVKSIGMAFSAAGQGAFADETEHPGVSGATLAYEYVFKPLALTDGGHVAPLARLAGVRDTWQKKDPDWQAACEQAEALAWWPNEHLLDPKADWTNILALGPVLWEKKLDTAAKVAERAYHFVTKEGTHVALFQGMRMSSDASEALGADVDLAIGYDLLFEDGAFKMGFSTRSRATYDCKALAQAHGGGGHTRAAGFNVKLNVKRAPNPYRVAKIVLDAYEGSLWAKIQKAFLL
jgi:oligoribonuclease NrnB/cAMP/cGMP phosphodiesterase (DHH superfamily)